MKKIIFIVLGIAVIGIVIWLSAPDSTSSSSIESDASTQTNSAQVAVTATKNGTAYIYDVRTPVEFETRHVEGAINLDLEIIKTGTLPNIPKDSQIYLYCRSGNRSNQARELLSANGYTNVIDLGGLTDLEKAGVL